LTTSTSSSSTLLTLPLLSLQTLDSYELVRSRTIELERIHETSVILKQLRQFNHAKTQLEHYTRTGEVTRSHDLRQSSTMAKIVQELETLLRSPALSSLAIVKESTGTIKRVGSQLRSSSQEQLLNALNEQNQATIAECLQVRLLRLLLLSLSLTSVSLCVTVPGVL
jgi:hypothetical protein